MSFKRLARTTALTALIVSPTIVLLAMQMPLWLPPKPVALTRVARVDFVPPSIDRDPASLDVTVGLEALICTFALRYDGFCEFIRTATGAD
jgi:hypothetical protein